MSKRGWLESGIPDSKSYAVTSSVAGSTGVVGSAGTVVSSVSSATTGVAVVVVVSSMLIELADKVVSVARNKHMRNRRGQ